MAVLDKVTDFLLFLGKLLIVGLVGESVCSVFIPCFIAGSGPVEQTMDADWYDKGFISFTGDGEAAWIDYDRVVH